MKLQVVIEKGENVLYGRIDGNEYFSPVTAADTKKELMENLRMLIADYLAHEGKDDGFWKKVDANTVDFDVRYDLEAFFKNMTFLMHPPLPAIPI